MFQDLMANTFNNVKDSILLAYANSCGSFSVSSLAWFMSMQESSFVTLGQRVLARPLK